MTSLRRTTPAVLVWLTAVTTLIAGLPHLDCLCPGDNASVSGATASAPRTCCCHGGCCGQHPEGTCCPSAPAKGGAQHRREARPPVAAKSAGHYQVEPGTCNRALGTHEEAAIAAERRGTGDVKPAPVAVALGHSMPVMAQAAPAAAFAPPPGSTPTTDRVITFLHLVI